MKKIIPFILMLLFFLQICVFANSNDPIEIGNDTKITYDKFAQKIKNKYPEYIDINDLELSKKVVEKYPVYKDYVIFDNTYNDDSKHTIEQNRIFRVNIILLLLIFIGMFLMLFKNIKNKKLFASIITIIFFIFLILLNLSISIGFIFTILYIPIMLILILVMISIIYLIVFGIKKIFICSSNRKIRELELQIELEKLKK